MKTFEQYETEIIKVIEANNLFVISDIFAFYTGIKSSQFYNLKLEKSDNLLKSIDDNKKKTCQSLKSKWYKSDNATLQIALFKTISSESDLRKLSQTWQNIDGDINLKNDVSKIFPKELD